MFFFFLGKNVEKGQIIIIFRGKGQIKIFLFIKRIN